MEMQNEKKGWSWLGFLFAPFYYAGYGKFVKGLLLFFIGIVPLFGLMAFIYGGLRAKKDLPINMQKFRWLNVIGLIGIGVAIIGVVFKIFMGSLTMETTPSCKDEVVIENLYAQFKKQTAENMKQLDMELDDTMWESMGFEIFNFQTESYDESSDSYECKANASMRENRDLLVPISYRVSSKNNSLIVEVKDLKNNEMNFDVDADADYDNVNNSFTPKKIILTGTIVATHDEAGGGYGISADDGVYHLCYVWDDIETIEMLDTLEDRASFAIVQGNLIDNYRLDCDSLSIEPVDSQ